MVTLQSASGDDNVSKLIAGKDSIFSLVIIECQQIIIIKLSKIGRRQALLTASAWFGVVGGVCICACACACACVYG